MSTIEIRLFAGLADRLGGKTIEVDLTSGLTCKGLLDRLATDHPDAAGLLQSCRVAVDREFTPPEAEIPSGSEIALIPPVSGG